MSLSKEEQLRWDEILKEFEVRTVSVNEFCESRGVQLSHLRYHQRKAQKKSSSPFVEVPKTFSPIGSQPREMLLEFPNGLRLTIKG